MVINVSRLGQLFIIPLVFSIKISILNNASFLFTATPRTPAPITDRILQEAQNMMALTHVDTPLKGGLNTPLHDSDFSGALPKGQSVATPNTVLATPFRSVRSDAGGATGGFMTPQYDRSTLSAQCTVNPGSTPATSGGFTPVFVRDKLNINQEENMDDISTPAANKNYQLHLKTALREGLSTLPAPKNDYEIVVPEGESEDLQADSMDVDDHIEDQADVDAKRIADIRAKLAKELSMRSQVIQRELPRPIDINLTVLRPPTEMLGLTELQRAEELVKQEMVKMMHYDAIKDPIVIPGAVTKKNMIAQYQSYLDMNPYDTINEHDLELAKSLLNEEMQTVKSGMQHGDLSLESYTQVWQECLSQVLYLPSQNRYTRASMYLLN